MKISYITIISMLTFAASCLQGCGPRHENAGTGAAVGGVVGAGTGAAIGNQSGNTAAGAAVGGVIGTVTGVAIGDVRDKAELSTEEQDAFMRRQKEEMKKQQQELEDLRRQKFHDDYYRSQYQKKTE